MSVRLMGEQWVLHRHDGHPRAFRDRCPHRGAPLSAGTVVDGDLQCAYHGWRFDGSGRCTAIPALGADATIPSKAALTVGHVSEHGGLIWLAPDAPVTPLPPLPGFEQATQYLVTDWAAGAAQMMDNFLDVGHFAFSHAGSFGVADDHEAVDMQVQRRGWTVTVEHRHRARLVDSMEWELGLAAPHQRTQRFRYDPPFTMHLDIAYDAVPDEVSLLFVVQPVDALHSRLYTSAVRNDAAASRCTPDAAFERAMLIIDEDRRVLETLGEPWFDPDPAAEMHTRADRNTLALRHVLADLVAAVDPVDVTLPLPAPTVAAHDLPPTPTSTTNP